jgi:hypothetical protein
MRSSFFYRESWFGLFPYSLNSIDARAEVIASQNRGTRIELQIGPNMQLLRKSKLCILVGVELSSAFA